MNTSGEVSTISYNSEYFLRCVLDDLYRLHIISDWMYIIHQPEEDEKKVHTHLWMKPNTKIDTIDIQERFCELDPEHVKPLKCIDFRKSKCDDWILYNQHFRPYLVTKMEDRIYFYQKTDFRYCDEDTFEFNYMHAFKSSDWAKDSQIRTLLCDPEFNRADLILNGALPLQQSGNLLALDTLERKLPSTIRGSHGKTHD